MHDWKQRISFAADYSPKLYFSSVSVNHNSSTNVRVRRYKFNVLFDLNVMEEFFIYVIHLDCIRVWISLQVWCESALAPLVLIIVTRIEPVYVMYLRFIPIFLISFLRTIEVLPHHYCPRRTWFMCVQKMTSKIWILFYPFISAHTIFYRTLFKCFEFFSNIIEPEYVMYIRFVLVLFFCLVKNRTSAMMHKDLQILEEFGSRIVLYRV